MVGDTLLTLCLYAGYLAECSVSVTALLTGFDDLIRLLLHAPRECSTNCGQLSREAVDAEEQGTARLLGLPRSFTRGLPEHSLGVSLLGIVQFPVLDHEHRAQELLGDLVCGHPEQEGRH